MVLQDILKVVKELMFRTNDIFLIGIIEPVWIFISIPTDITK